MTSRRTLFLALLLVATALLGGALAFAAPGDPTWCDIHPANPHCSSTSTTTTSSTSTTTTTTPTTTTPATALPSIPTGLTIMAGDGQVSLSWGPNPEAEGVDLYQVYPCPSSGSVNCTTWTDTATTSTTITSLNGSEVCYRVSAHNAAGYGEWTDTACATPQGAGSPPTPTVAIPGTFLVCYGGCPARVGNGRYDVIDQSPGGVDNLKLAKDESNGATTVLAYKDASVAGTDCGTSTQTPDWCGTPISYPEANAHDQANPDDPWLLSNASGGHVLDNYGHYLMNLGSASYQEAALPHLRHTLTVGSSPHVIPTGYRFDGIFWDNTNPSSSGRASSPLYYKGAPFTESMWHDAQVSWSRNVSQTLRNEGDYMLCNCGSSVGTSDQVNWGDATMTWFGEIGQYNDGLMYEFWEDYGGNGNMWNWIVTPDYRGWFDERFRVPDAAQPRNDFFPLGKGDCSLTASMVYSRVAFLLKWDGTRHGGWGCMGVNTGTWNPDVMTWVGTPVADKILVGDPSPSASHGYVRYFTDGAVVLNPDETTQPARTFALSGTYKKPDGTLTTSVTLAPRTAMILTKP